MCPQFFVCLFIFRPSPSFFDFKHRSSVYNLTYGPTSTNIDSDQLEGGGSDGVSLYSLGDGLIFMHKGQKGQKPTNIEDIIAKTNEWQRKSPSRSELVFQPVVQKYLAIGCDDGTVEIFAMPNLKIVCTLKSFQKLIQSLAWQPFDEKRSNDLFAVASNEYDIHIWSLQEKLVNNNGDVFTKPETVLTGHKLRVIQCLWSPHDHNRLLSVSYDGTAQVKSIFFTGWHQIYRISIECIPEFLLLYFRKIFKIDQVWDVEATQGLANFRGHNGRVFCCLWSSDTCADDQELILTGGEDCMVMAWKPSKQPEKIPIKLNNKVKWTDKRATHVKDANDEVKEAMELRKTQILNGLAESSPEPGISDANVKEVKETTGGSKSKKLNKKCYFGMSIFKEAVMKDKVYDDILTLLNEEEVNVTKSPHLAFFSRNPKDLESLIDLEVENSTAAAGGVQDISANLYQWSAKDSSLKNHLKNQIGHLSDFHVNLAASYGYETWKWACSTYAKQLEDKGNVVKSSSYFLMVIL